MHATLHLLTRTDFPALRRRTVETLQLNLGYRCATVKVSTHSRPKAAGETWRCWVTREQVSTHSRPKAAGF